MGITVTLVVVGATMCGAVVLGALVIALFLKTARSNASAGSAIEQFAAASGMVRVADERAERPGPDGREHAELSWFREGSRPRILLCGIQFAHPFGLGLQVVRRRALSLDPAA